MYQEYILPLTRIATLHISAHLSSLIARSSRPLEALAYVTSTVLTDSPTKIKTFDTSLFRSHKTHVAQAIRPHRDPCLTLFHALLTAWSRLTSCFPDARPTPKLSPPIPVPDRWWR
jgi:hypothetical protein